MGLKKGATSTWKTFILNLFPDCVIQGPERFKAIVSTVDMVMTDLNIVTHNECGSSYSKYSLNRKLRTFIQNQFDIFNNAKVFIGTMDDSRHVPKAKKVEQRERDRKNESAGLIFTEEQLKQLGPFAYLTKWGDVESVPTDRLEKVLRSDFDAKEAKKKTDKEERLKKRRKTQEKALDPPSTPEDRRRVEQDKLFVYFLERALHTRETRRDLLHYVTKQLLMTPQRRLIGGRKIILDGVPYATNPHYCRMPEFDTDEMEYISDGIYIEKKDIFNFYECEVEPCLISMSDECIEKQTEYDTKFIGEGDIKSAFWITQCAKEGKSMYFQCSDTDLIVIILILFKCLEANGYDIPCVYLDFTHGKNIPVLESLEHGDRGILYRKLAETRQVYDMYTLYYRLVTRLPKMWKGVKDPVMTFCLAAMANGTDFFDSPTNIGIGTVRMAVLTGGYTLLDNAIKLSFKRNGSSLSDPIPTAVINEQRLMEFWKYCYAWKKLGALKKDRDVASKLMEATTTQVEKARLVMWPSDTEVKKGRDEEAKVIVGLKRSRVDLIDKSFMELVEHSERPPDDITIRDPWELMREQLTLPAERDEIFSTIRREYIFNDENLLKYWRLKLKPDPEDIMYAGARRWAWNLLYWIFAYRCSFSDVSMHTNGSGESHFGYSEETDHSSGSSLVNYSNQIFSV